jgi:hypothetical protein
MIQSSPRAWSPLDPIQKDRRESWASSIRRVPRGGDPNGRLWARRRTTSRASRDPNAALALVRRVLRLLNTAADLTDLSEAARQFEQNLNGIVAQNAKIAEYVAKLEKKKPDEDEEADADADAARDELPPSADLVAEIEQFLRQQHPENP